MSALGSLVVKLALDYAEYTQGLDRSSQEALKFAKGAQTSFDQAGRSAKEFMGNVAGNVAGAVVSVVGLNAAFTRVRDSINVLESLDDAAQKTGSSVEDLSRIAKVAKNFGDAFAPIEQGITRLAKGLAQIDNPSSDAIRALNAIGVSARDSNGQLRTAADVYIDVARSLQQYKDGAEKTAVATALFGKSGAELLPMLNNLAGGIDNVKATSAASAQQASMFNDAVAKSKAGVNGLFMSLAVDLLPTLNNIAGAVNQSAGQIGGFSVASESAKVVLKGLAIAAYTVVDTFQGMGREIGARAAQLMALAQMDFKGAKFIGQALAEDSAKSRAAYDKFIDTVLNGEKKISAAVDTGERKLINFQTQIPSAVDSATKSIEKQAKAFDMELYKLKEYDKEAARARDITQSVASKQEIYNQTLAELERLKPYLSIETYNRALEKAQKTLNDTGAVNRSVVSEMDQLWMQAGRNIQSTLANSIFDFFNGGLDDMWRNAKIAVGRILSEFAALKLAQSIGLTAMFAVPGTAAASGNVGGAVSGGASAWDIANLGTSALNLFKGGFGVPGFIGNMGSSLPGSMGSFFSGMAGKTATQLAAESGAMSLWGASGASTGMAASMGSAFAAAAGPLMAAYMATQLFRGLAGDRRIGGGFGKFINKIGDIPILGDLMPGIPLLNALFGRGPLKQKETTLSGLIGLEGFESGMLQTRFKASGSVFRSSKTDFARVDAITGEIWTDNQKQLGEFAQGLSKAAKEIFGAFNDAAKETSTLLKQVGDDLGLSNDALEGFQYQINLVSEKGKALTDEQIGQEIENLTDAMARKFLPQVDDLAKRGETALQTVSRLGVEFTSLVDAAALLLGKSVADSRSMVMGASFEDRTGVIDSAGGLDKFNQDVAYFAQSFLTDAERLAPAQEKLNEQLVKLGLSTDLTKDQFRGLVQSFGSVNGISKETLVALLDLAPAFVQVTDAAQQTVSRLGVEFTSLVDAAALLLGKSVADSRSMVMGASFEDRTGVIDSAGGLDKFNQDVAYFAQNFLTDAERLAPAQEKLNEQLVKLGLSTDLTKDQFRGLVQSFGSVNGISKETLVALLDLAPAFVQVTDAAQAAIMQPLTNNYESSLVSLRSVWDEEEARLKNMINQFDGIAEKLKNFKSALLQGNLSPLDPLQKYLAAKSEFESVSKSARLGDIDAADRLQGVSQAFLEASQGYYASSPQYATDFQSVMTAVEGTESMAERQVKILSRQLAAEEKQVSLLIDLKKEVRSLQGAIDAAVTARDALAAAQASAGSSESSVVAIDPSVGNRTVSDQDIRDYVTANASDPMRIYRAAQAYGVTASRLSSVTGITLAQINDFVRVNNLPSFDVGANYIPRAMIARLHPGEEVKPLAYVDRERAERAKTNNYLAQLVVGMNKNTEALGKLHKRMDGVEKQARLRGAA